MPRSTTHNLTTLYIKNMVCNRCIRVVREEMESMGLSIQNIVLGEVVVSGKAKSLPMDTIRTMLEKNGFELIQDRRTKIIEQVKLAIIKFVQRDSGDGSTNLKASLFIEQELGREYHYLSTMFSSIENITIEQYIILQKIERAKELIKYGELTLGEIAYQLGYSSVQHLSNQFKKVTGLTATQFKDMTLPSRKPIDQVGKKK